MKKFRNYQVGSPEYVILHALWRHSRGKRRFSVSFLNKKNPQEALIYAIRVLQWKNNVDGWVKKYFDSNPFESHRKVIFL